MSTFYCVECEEEESRSDLEDKSVIFDSTRFHGVCSDCVDKERKDRSKQIDDLENLQDRVEALEFEKDNQQERIVVLEGEKLLLVQSLKQKVGHIRSLEAQIENMTELA